MQHLTYLTITSALLGAALISLIVAVASFVMAAIGWRGPKRTSRLIRGSLFLLLASIVVVTQLAIAHFIFLPSLRHESYEAVREWRSTGLGDKQEASKTLVGDAAPPFKVTLDDGSTFKLSDLRGKVVLLNFFGSNCGACVLEMPHIQRIRGKHRERDDLYVLAVGRGETVDTVSRFKAKHHLTIPMAADEDSAIFGLYASSGIPRTYVVSKDGTIAFQMIGFWDADDFHDDLTAIEEAVKNALSKQTKIGITKR
jgi:peroxiredoxin